jgi:4'-phosphopantetheinyl transferase
MREMNAVPPLHWTPEGKPYFMTDAGRFEFSVSHSGDYIVCLTGKRPVGVDVERLAAPPEEIAARCFTPAELQYLSSVPESDRGRMFFSLWCLKESVLKARGKGFLDDPREIELIGTDGTPCARTDGFRLSVSWLFPGHCLAWCAGQEEDGCVFVPVAPKEFL